MKKFLSIFLTVALVLVFTVVAVSAAGITQDENGIYCMNLLDFNQETNDLWAELVDGKWQSKIAWDDPYSHPTSEPDGEGTPIAPVLKPYSSYSAHRWELTEGGEVLHFESTDSSVYPGISFLIDAMHNGAMQIGKETGDPKKAEYAKIRVRNHSVCDQITFVFVTNSTNGGKFVGAAISEMTVDADGKEYGSSGEWETYTFSFADINQNTNYEELIYDPATQEPKTRWGGQLYELLIFPFGYNVTDGTGNYPGAAMDIDYLVLGSRDYVDNYQSALEQKEAAIESLELITAPTKTKYYVGEALDLDGLQLKATYNDGREDEILTTASSSVSTFIQVENEVTLKFGSKSVTFPVEVVDITGIEVKAEPEDTTFEIDEFADGFVSDGYQIQVNYADGTSKFSDVNPSEENGALLSNSSFKFVGDLTTTGNKTIEVFYFGHDTSFEITNIQISDIEFVVNRNYRYGSKPSIADFAITLVFNDGSKKAITETEFKDFFEAHDVKCNVKTPGAAKATITVNDTTYSLSFTKEVDVTVDAPTDIAVETNEKTWKTEYNIGDTLETKGLTVYLVYGEDKVKMDTADYTTKANLNSAGKKSVQIRSEVEGLKEIFDELKPKTEVTVLGDAGSDESSSSSSTTPITPPSGGNDNGWVLPVIIVAAVLVVGGGVVVVIVVIKKKKTNN